MSSFTFSCSGRCHFIGPIRYLHLTEFFGFLITKVKRFSLKACCAIQNSLSVTSNMKEQENLKTFYQALMNYISLNGLKIKLHHGTQTSNLSSLKLWQDVGLRLHSTCCQIQNCLMKSKKKLFKNFDVGTVTFRNQNFLQLLKWPSSVRHQHSKFLTCRISDDFKSQKNFVLKFSGDKGTKVHHRHYPLSATARQGNGLKLKLLENKNFYADDRCSALSFVVHSPFELAASYNTLDMIEFGYNYDIDILITPEIIRTDEDLKSIDPKQRGCYFKDERQLKFFKVYTRRNCEFECLAGILSANSRLNCTPFYMVRNNDMEMCDYRHQMDVQYASEKANSLSKSSCDCFDECDSIKYNIEVIAHELIVDENLTVNRYMRLSTEHTFETELSFKFKDVDIVPLRRYRQITLTDFLAQSGGMMGLFAGISALSIIELFYFLTLRWMVNGWRWMKEYMNKRWKL